MIAKTATLSKKTAKTAGTKQRASSPARAPVRAEVSDEPIEVVLASMATGVVLEAMPIVVTAKQKLVRDSFTMPSVEYEALDALKLRLLQMSRSVKKGELLRAGVNALTCMSDADLLSAIAQIPSLKTGRPKNGAKSKKKS